MESLISVSLLAVAGYVAFHQGKRLGSRKAFRVGFDRARRRFRPRRR